jgi:type VI secretion system protein ImpA
MDDGDSGGGPVDAGDAGDAGTLTGIDRWLQPLAGEACGEDLEYDNDFLELTQAAAGKPETQFAPAEPPDWRQVTTKAEALFERTRDLRVAILWMRSQISIEGWGSLPESLRLLHGLLDRYWDELHPRPDDGDAYARINALEALDSSEHLLGELRPASILRSRAFGELRGRDIEIAFQHVEPRDDESPPSRSQIEQMLREAAGDEPALVRLAADSNERLDAITALMRERVGYERAPGFDALHAALNDLQQVLPSADAAGSSEELDLGDAGAPARGARAGHGALGDSIESRDDALRAIDMVCDFLERTEPTNPAQLLLRRARRLVNKNFLELVQELAPDALAEVARLMGVAPDTIGGGGSGEA